MAFVICAWCRRLRGPDGQWVDSWMGETLDPGHIARDRVSQGLCDRCAEGMGQGTGSPPEPAPETGSPA